MDVGKLAAMTPHELAHRGLEKISVELERHGIGAAYPRAPQGIAFKSYLRESCAARFYRGVREGARGFVAGHFPEWRDTAVSEAEAICRHEFEILGYGIV